MAGGVYGLYDLLEANTVDLLTPEELREKLEARTRARLNPALPSPLRAGIACGGHTVVELRDVDNLPTLELVTSMKIDAPLAPSAAPVAPSPTGTSRAVEPAPSCSTSTRGCAGSVARRREVEVVVERIETCMQSTPVS